MIWDRLVVKLREAIGRPGVAFVALTRATHPDGLALDDFPAMSIFQRQKKHKHFQQRQQFERLARARFSRTIRMHMREAHEEASYADVILRVIRHCPRVTLTSFASEYANCFPESEHTEWRQDLLGHIWERLHTQYPHMFAVAVAK